MQRQTCSAIPQPWNFNKSHSIISTHFLFLSFKYSFFHSYDSSNQYNYSLQSCLLFSYLHIQMQVKDVESKYQIQLNLHLRILNLQTIENRMNTSFRKWGETNLIET